MSEIKREVLRRGLVASIGESAIWRWLSEDAIRPWYHFSIVQRKVLTPNDFNSLTALEDRLLAFQEHYQMAAKPFSWRFTRHDLEPLLARLAACPKAA